MCIPISYTLVPVVCRPPTASLLERVVFERGSLFQSFLLPRRFRRVALDRRLIGALELPGPDLIAGADVLLLDHHFVAVLCLERNRAHSWVGPLGVAVGAVRLLTHACFGYPYPVVPRHADFLFGSRAERVTTGMRKDELASAFWRIVQIEELLSDRHRLWSRQYDDASIEIVFTRSGIWVVLGWRSGVSVAFRAVFSPGSLTVKNCSVEGDGLLIDAETRIGRQVCDIGINSDEGVFTFRNMVLPRSYLTFEAWSRDIVPLTPGPQAAGQVHSGEDDHRAGQLHASVADGGAFVYVQELASLSALCGATRATLAHSIGGAWPDLGFVPPRGRKALSPSDGPTVLTHAHVAWNAKPPSDPGDAVEGQLALLAAIYLDAGRNRPPNDVQSADRWERERPRRLGQ